MSAVDEHFDLIIIGTGSGNSLPSPENEHKKIAIVESGRFGGTCLNVGCIPTKMYVYAAEVAHTVATSAKLGVDASLNGVDWAQIRSRVFDKRIDPIAEGGEAYRRGDETPNITVFDRPAKFIAPRTIETGQGDERKVISAEQIVVAAGARPFIPEVIADSGVDYHTNETIMRIDDLPKSLTVLGGGYIALEFAHVFQAFGVNVTVINRSDALLRSMDKDISERITEITKNRMRCLLGKQVTGATQDAAGVTVTLDDDTQVTSEMLLVATGRVPNADLLDVEAAGIEVDGKRIKIDEFGRTSAEGVWALGDIANEFMLKHVANAEARAIQHNLEHPDDLRKLPHENVPAGVFTLPQIGTVGLSEQEALDAGYTQDELAIKIQQYGDVAYGWAMEDTEHFVKLIAHKASGKILGAHFIGPQATTLLQQVVTAMAFDIPARDLATKQFWTHPALAEVTENALLGLELD